ncbi:hypothetical protein MHU86_8608 [Fragilaria crotonensis]|nr:hypothetical protein MHU86_8608 [Fragilaria crotonensis]
MLLKKIQHPQLQNAVSALLRIRAQLDSVLTFTECANHLSAIVSELPDHQLNRKISATHAKPKAKRIRGGGTSNSLASKCKGMHMPDGSVWTGFYSDLDKMSDADKETVMETRKKNKAKGTTRIKRKVSDVA